MTPSSDRKKFFDLHVTGLGYVNRVREIRPRKASPFLACDIAALNGPTDAVEYLRFDVKVSGTEAQRLILKYRQAIEEERKVLIGFRLGDLWIDRFTYSKGENAGKPGVSLKARLLFISWIKIDGTLEYKADTATSEAAPASGETAAEEDDVPTAERLNGTTASPAEAPAQAASF